MTDRPKLHPLSVALLAATCVAFSVIPFRDTAFPAYLWHLTPFFAVGMLYGAGMATWRGVLLVLGMRLAADLGVWAVTSRPDYAFYGSAQFWNYAGLLLLPLFGRFMTPGRWGRVLGGALAGSVAFFLVSNFGVWMAGGGRSLLRVYADGLPFFRNELIATPVWAGVLFAPPVFAALCEGRSAANRVTA